MFYPARFPKPCRIYQTYLQGQKRPCRKQKNPAKFNFCRVFKLFVVTEYNSAMSGEIYLFNSNWLFKSKISLSILFNKSISYIALILTLLKV